MSNPDEKLEQRALFWAKLKQRGEQLALARAALIEGRLPVARRLFLESHELEQAAQHLAGGLTIGIPPALVATTLNQAIKEAYTAIVQGDLSAAADIRMRLEGIAEIEQSIPNSLPATALALLPQALFEKSRQALRSKQFDRAEEYLDQLIAQGKAGAELDILRTDILLARARHLRSNDGNPEEAQILLDRARIAKDAIPTEPSNANWRAVFERDLGEEQTALYYATGEQAQRQWQLRRALAAYHRIPPASAYGSQAQARIAAINQNVRLVLFSALVVLAIIGFFAFQRFRNPPNVAANTPVPTVVPTQQTTVIVVTATTAPTSQPTADSSATINPTAATISPTAAAISPTALPVIQFIQATTDIPVYRNSVRRKGEEVGSLRSGKVMLLCEFNGTEGSYLIAEKSCATPLGWVNQRYVNIITTTPTP